MAGFVDFQDLKSKVTIQQVLEMLGVSKLKAHGEALRGHCPCCQEGGDRAFVVTPSKGSYYCFGERHGGDMIELAARFWRISPKDAAGRIAAHFGIGRAATAGKAEAPAAADSTGGSGFDFKAYQASLDPAHASLADCGIAEQTIRDFGGGFCSRGLHRGRLTLPVQDAAGDMLGFMGLALKGEEPDILLPKGFDPPPLFAAHRVVAGVLYLVRHPKDVLKATEAGLENVICPMVPLTADVLDALAALMRERGSESLEIH